MNEHVGDDQVGRVGEPRRLDGARVRALDDRHALVLAQRPVQLAVGDVERDDRGGAALQQAVGEAARGGADVERAAARRRRRPSASSALASLIPPRETYGGGAVDLELGVARPPSGPACRPGGAPGAAARHRRSPPRRPATGSRTARVRRAGQSRRTRALPARTVADGRSTVAAPHTARGDRREHLFVNAASHLPPHPRRSPSSSLGLALRPRRLRARPRTGSAPCCTLLARRRARRHRPRASATSSRSRRTRRSTAASSSAARRSAPSLAAALGSAVAAVLLLATGAALLVLSPRRAGRAGSLAR